MQSRYIPQNVMSNERILGFKKRNFVEMLIEILLLFPTFTLIPFTVKARWVFLISFAVAIAIINFVGVQGNSPIHALFLMFKYSKITKIRYSYRRFDNDTSRGIKEVISNGKVKTFRTADRTRKLKQIIGI